LRFLKEQSKQKLMQPNIVYVLETPCEENEKQTENLAKKKGDNTSVLQTTIAQLIVNTPNFSARLMYYTVIQDKLKRATLR
jgi:hypothetical protein